MVAAKTVWWIWHTEKLHMHCMVTLFTATSFNFNFFCPKKTIEQSDD